MVPDWTVEVLALCFAGSNIIWGLWVIGLQKALIRNYDLINAYQDENNTLRLLADLEESVKE